MTSLNLVINRSYKIVSNLFHLFTNGLKFTILDSTFFEIVLELCKTDLKYTFLYLVAILILAKSVTLLLDSIIGEMDKEVINIIEFVLRGGCSEVALSIPVTLHIAIDLGDEEKPPDVELPPFETSIKADVQIAVLHIFLDDDCSSIVIIWQSLSYLLNYCSFIRQ